MTTVSLKLVGNSNDILIKIAKDEITVLDIISFFLENNMPMTQISQIMFINNGKNITNDTSAVFTGTDENPLIIHLFTNRLEIKNEIIKYIFSNDESNELNELNGLIQLDIPPYSICEANRIGHTDINTDYEDISKEETNKNNLKLVELFSDKDFVYLLNIIINKPELINKATNYILNGNISSEIKIINEDEFKYPNELSQLFELLNTINKELDVSQLKSIIQHFEGNLNLSLRYILNK